MDTKAKIKTRILKHAAQFWGFSETDLDVKAFDPILELFAGAMSTELALVNKELATSRSRIEERVLEHLTPDIIINAIPSHAIMHARSVETTYETKLKDQFFTTKDDEQGSRDIYFSPAGKFPIINGDVRYLAIDQSVYQVENTALREAVLHSSPDKKIPPGTVWLGLDLDNNLASLDLLTFFIDWRNEPASEQYLSALHSARWTIQGHELIVQNELRQLSMENIADEYSQTQRISRKVINYYKDHFFRVQGFSDNELSSWTSFKLIYPPELEAVFELEDLIKWTAPLLWIKLEIPQWIPQEALQRMVCHLNAFPVINRRYYSKDFSLREHANILPLATEFSFFDVAQIINQSKEEYRATPLSNSSLQQAGTYTLRRKAIGKFKDRDARNHLDTLINLLRDEADAFAAFDLTYLRGKLENMKQQLTSLEQHMLSQQGSKEFVPYLFIRPKEINDRVSVSYWEINGADANNLASGLRLEMYRTNAFRRSHIHLLTASRGGRDRLSPTQQKYIYKNALLSRGRIVTIEDVRTYCQAQVYPLADRVEIKKSYRVSDHPKEGIIAVLAVDIYAKPDKYPTLKTRQFDLEKEVNQQSSTLLPIVIKIRADE